MEEVLGHMDNDDMERPYGFSWFQHWTQNFDGENVLNLLYKSESLTEEYTPSYVYKTNHRLVKDLFGSFFGAKSGQPETAWDWESRRQGLEPLCDFCFPDSCGSRSQKWSE